MIRPNDAIQQWEDEGGAPETRSEASESDNSKSSSTNTGSDEDATGLPVGRLDWLTASFSRFFRIHALAAAALLLASTMSAVVGTTLLYALSRPTGLADATAQQILRSAPPDLKLRES